MAITITIKFHFLGTTAPNIPKSLPLFGFAFKIVRLQQSTTTMAAATATKVVPAIIVSGERVGQPVQDMGTDEDVLVKRCELVPVSFAGTILVYTSNDEAIPEPTPESRRDDTNWGSY